MSAGQKLASVVESGLVESGLFEKISAFGLFLPCFLDPAIYTFKVQRSPVLDPQDKRLMIQQTWVHNGFNLLMEGVSFLVFRVVAAKWLCKSAGFMNFVTRRLNYRPSADFIIKSAPLIGVCAFKSLARPFAMFRAALRMEKKKEMKLEGSEISTKNLPARPTLPPCPSPNVHYGVLNSFQQPHVLQVAPVTTSPLAPRMNPAVVFSPTTAAFKPGLMKSV